jgi:hypothetical protein
MPKIVQSDTKGLFQQSGTGFDIETADLRGTPSTVGVTEITVVTAADASHTLSVSAPGLVRINAALASGSVIKLPAATADNVGLYYKIIFEKTMAAAASIRLPNGGTGNFSGCVIVERCGSSGAGVAEHATFVRAIAIVPGSSKQQIVLDENDASLGGGIGTTLEFYYASTTEVIVTGRILVNVASTVVTAATATTFTATGY